MKYLILILFIFTSKIALEQEIYKSENEINYSKYNFINHDINYFYNASDNLTKNFFNKIDTLILYGNKKIKILQIGDSHIQADIYTYKIREYFKDFFLSKISPPSFIFPYKPLLNTNEPISYKTFVNKNVNAYSVIKNDTIISTTGLIFEIYPSDTVIIGIKTDNKIYNEFNTLKFFISSYFNIQVVFPDGYDKILNECNGTLMKQYCIKLNDYTDSCVVLLYNNTNNKVFVYGIALDDDNYGISYSTLGINGLKAKTLNKLYFEDLLICDNYDLFILSIGTNDCFNDSFDSTEVFNYYNSLFLRIRKVKPDMPILVVIPMSFFNNKKNEPEKNILIVKNILLFLSIKWNCAFWDLFQVSGGLNAIEYWAQNNLTATDKVHLNKKGYYFVAYLFFEAFYKTYMLR